MQNKIIRRAVTGILVALIALPFGASAQSVSDLQSQIAQLQQTIKNLESEIAQLKQNQTTPPTQPPATPPTKPMPPTRCLPIERDLSRGTSGSDVTDLQKFLAQYPDIYPEKLVTGYFGPATERAMNKLDANQGTTSPVVTKTMTGTNTAIWRGKCIPPPIPVGASFKADPRYGNAPLTVTFTVGQSTAVSGESIDFGDGSTPVAVSCVSGNLPTSNNACGTLTHTYTNSGTYNALLINDNVVPIMTTNSTSNTNVSSGSSYPTVVDDTRGTPTTMPPTGDSWRGHRVLGSIMILVKGSTDTGGNLPPVISEVGGPTTLATGQSGTWTVRASGPEYGDLSYMIDWGDMPVNTAMTGASTDKPASIFVQTSTFTHSYATAGVYTIRVVVRDAGGKTAMTTRTVKVGDGAIACTMEYAPVCGQPKFFCPPGLMCPQVMPMPKTYGNSCMLKADGATFLYQGECKSPISVPPPNTMMQTNTHTPVPPSASGTPNTY